MSLSRDSVLEAVLNSYKSYFDIERVVDQGSIVAKACFHSRTEKFVLVKSVKVWVVETNDYVYVYSTPFLDLDEFTKCKEKSISEGLMQIHPHNEHMCSYITAIILADTIDPLVISKIKSCKFSKNFLLTFHGWAILRLLVLDINTPAVIANKAGKELTDFLSSCLKEVS